MIQKIEVNCGRCDGAGKHYDWGSRGERYMASCLSCSGTGKQWETDVQLIERLTAAVSDVQEQIDAERKAHAETRVALEAQGTLNDQLMESVLRLHPEMRDLFSALADAALAASTRAKDGK